MDVIYDITAAIVIPYIASALVLVTPTSWRIKSTISITALVVSFLLLVTGLLNYLHANEAIIVSIPFAPSLGVYLSLRIDALSCLMGLIVAFLSLLIAIYSIDYIGSWGATRYWFFYTFFVASMLLLVYANDLMLLFIGWEGTGLASFMLISFYYDDREEAIVGDKDVYIFKVPAWSTPTHSGLRALVFTRLGDVGLLLSIAYISLVIGDTVYDHVSHAFIKLVERPLLATLLLLLFYLGALAKSAQFPFHEWLVTAMTGPTSVSALIHAATMVKAGVYFALRFTPMLFEELKGIEWFNNVMGLLLAISLITMFSTATMALVARELKLILAYSTVSQLAYMLAAVYASAISEHVEEGIYASFSHLLSHALFKAALFLTAGAIIHVLHTRYIDSMGGLAKYMKVSFIAFLLAGFSLAGIPPFLGWWTKDSIVHVLSAISPFAGMIALATGMLTAAYTTRMIFYVFLSKPHFKHLGKLHEPSALMLLPYTILALLSFALGIAWPVLGSIMASLFATHITVNIVGLAIGASAAILATTLTYMLYKSLQWVIDSLSRLKPLYDFLYYRWFVNVIMYRLIVFPAQTLTRIQRRLEELVDKAIHVELVRMSVDASKYLALAEGIADKLLHVNLPTQVGFLAGRIRYTQTGDLRYYISYLLGGVVAAAGLTLLLLVR